MKKTSLALFLTLVMASLIWNWSCSNNPAGAGNFQAPVLTVVSINTPFTDTYTPTFTATPTSTVTNTPTSTATPYAVSTWTGFSSPSAIAVDGNGKVYVADTGNNFIERFNSNGVLDITWGEGGLKGKVGYTSPKGIAVDGNGSLYVVGNGNQVSKYVTVGSGVSLDNTFTSTTSGAGLSGPQGVGVNSAGSTVVVADTGNQKLVALDGSGNLINGFIVGTQVTGVAIDGNGNRFVATNPGNSVICPTSGPVTIPGFLNPQGLAIDSLNNLWVADTGRKQIEEFAPGGGLVLPPLVIFNASGTLNSPAGVAVDGNGTIYVVDSGANKVVKFEP